MCFHANSRTGPLLDSASQRGPARTSYTVPGGEPSVVDSADKQANKTLLENYWYNAFMTFFQDIPQTIALLVVLFQTGLHNDADNPTGVSLPGYLDLIPQFGNTAAGAAAGYEAIRLIQLSRRTRQIRHAFNAFLYSVFSFSTMLNGIDNTVRTLHRNNSSPSELANITTYIALVFNFCILCREEGLLVRSLYRKRHQSLSEKKGDQFHLICSINLNVSIVTSFLETSQKASHLVGAIGYLYGTWLGQVPELVEPTIERVRRRCCAEG